MRYKFWNKIDDIYSPVTGTDGIGRWTASEYIKDYIPWAELEEAKVVISTGIPNGQLIYSFSMMKEYAVQSGLAIPDAATDEEILVLMEEWETSKKRDVENAITTEERIAAALEFQNLMML